jgi:hypothetical protein
MCRGREAHVHIAIGGGGERSRLDARRTMDRRWIASAEAAYDLLGRIRATFVVALCSIATRSGDGSRTKHAGSRPHVARHTDNVVDHERS